MTSLKIKCKIYLFWLFLLLIIIAILIDEIFLRRFSSFSIGYIQAIFLGFITVCVPFLWNLYQKIIEIKDESGKGDIDDILNKKFYKKLDENFHRCLLYPLLLILFIGLICPIFLSLSKITIAVVMLITFISILNLTNIYNWIEQISRYNIEKFIKETKVDDDDLVKMYEALFKKPDYELQLIIYPPWLLEQFINKVSIIDKENVDKEVIDNIQKLLESFSKFFDNRSIWFLFPTNFFNKFLDFHFKIWKLYQRSDSKFSIEFSTIFSIVQNIFYQFFNSTLKEKEEWVMSVFFKNLEKHCEKFSKEINYIEELLSENIVFTFFEKVSESPFRYYLWHYFPNNWKITVNTIKDEKNIIVKILWNRFVRWSFERIMKAQTETFDAPLEEVVNGLFPLVEPTLWAPILIFVFRYSIEKSVKSVIEAPWTFGFISYKSYYDKNTYEFYNTSEYEYENTSEYEYTYEFYKNNTYELAKILFSRFFYNVNILDKENINKYLKEIKELEKSKLYEKSYKLNYKLNNLKEIFLGLLNSFEIN